MMGKYTGTGFLRLVPPVRKIWRWLGAPSSGRCVNYVIVRRHAAPRAYRKKKDVMLTIAHGIILIYIRVACIQ